MRVQGERVRGYFIRRFRDDYYVVLPLHPKYIFNRYADLRGRLLGGLRALDRILNAFEALVREIVKSHVGCHCVSLCRGVFFVSAVASAPPLNAVLDAPLHHRLVNLSMRNDSASSFDSRRTAGRIDLTAGDPHFAAVRWAPTNACFGR